MKLIPSAFAELERNINNIKTTGDLDVNGQYFVDPASFEEWATSVENLLQNCFKEDSVHLKNFTKYHSQFDGTQSIAHRCIGVFKAAKSDFERAQAADAVEKSKLDPWPVIQSLLAESQTSEEYKSLVQRSGLPVDWTLEGNDNYSNFTRIRAYGPRVDSTFRTLGENDRLRICAITARELAKREGYASKLKEALELIGWTINDGILTTLDSSVVDIFFPKGAVHGAYVEIRQILEKAQLSLDIADPYSDSTIFQMISASSARSLKIRILTSKLPVDFATEAKKFKQQYPPFELAIRTTTDFHDRFIIRDSKDCFHLGHSIKDFGSKACMLSQIQDELNFRAVRSQFDQSWMVANSFTF